MRGEGYSLSDIAAATGNGNNGFGNGFGDGAWWIIILFLFVFCGWGNNGWGNGNGSNGGGSVMDAYVLNSDFATLQRLIADGFTSVNTGINQVNQGLCNGFYQELVNINGVNTNIANSTFGIQQSLCQGFNGINSAIANCCCDVREGISGINYNMAQNTCAVTNAINMGIRDVVDNQNANYRALHDEIVANRIEDKNAQITAQQNEINALRLAASQEKQNSYLISQLAPKCPEPAYVVQPPQNVTFPTNCCGNVATFNSGCGCGSY